MHAMSVKQQRWRRMLSALLVAAAWLALAAQPARACSCAPAAGPDTAFREAAAVFTGQVTSVSGRRGFDLLERLRTIRAQPPLSFGMESLKAALSVADSWKGVTNSPVIVTTAASGAFCGYGFSVGGQYLVYAYNIEGTLHTDACLRTAKLSQVSADLAYLQTQPSLVVTQAAAGPPAWWLAAGAMVVVLLALSGAAAWVWRRRAATQP